MFKLWTKNWLDFGLLSSPRRHCEEYGSLQEVASELNTKCRTPRLLLRFRSFVVRNVLVASKFSTLNFTAELKRMFSRFLHFVPVLAHWTKIVFKSPSDLHVLQFVVNVFLQRQTCSDVRDSGLLFLANFWLSIPEGGY